MSVVNGKSHLAILVLGLGCGSASLALADLPRAAAPSDFYYDGTPPAELVELGRLLFFDKLLSGNRNISCATCHHPDFGSGDGLSLPVGEGGQGLGPERSTGEFPHNVPRRVGRNSQPLFNLGAREFVRLFHDGRVEVDPSEPHRFYTPAGAELPAGLDNVLAAQAMFPVASTDEMAGQEGENPIGSAAADENFSAVWNRLAERLREPRNGYVALFVSTFSDVSSPREITMVHAANALAAFQAQAWRSDNAPFDRYLAGDEGALDPAAREGMALFYGKARCAGCHSGLYLTDHGFHALAMPQIGPGKGNGFDGHDDFGRQNVTVRPADRHRFRTPSLRNVAFTGPWGHSGAYGRLEAVIRHHADPEAALASYDPTQTVLPERADLNAVDFAVVSDAARWTSTAGVDPGVGPLSTAEIELLVRFLDSLTDPASLYQPDLVPDAVPSGLPLD